MGACVSKNRADPAAGRAVVENAAFNNNAQQHNHRAPAAAAPRSNSTGGGGGSGSGGGGGSHQVKQPRPSTQQADLFKPVGQLLEHSGLALAGASQNRMQASFMSFGGQPEPNQFADEPVDDPRAATSSARCNRCNAKMQSCTCDMRRDTMPSRKLQLMSGKAANPANTKREHPREQQNKKNHATQQQQQQLQGAGLGLDASYSDSGGAKVQQAIAKLREEEKVTAAALATLEETKQVPKELLDIAANEIARVIGVTRVGILSAEQQLDEDSNLNVNTPLIHDRLKLLGALKVQLSLAKEWNMKKQITELDLFRLATDASKLSAAKFARKIPIVTDAGLDMRVVFGVLAMREAASKVATEAVHCGVPAQPGNMFGDLDFSKFKDGVGKIRATATSELDIDGVAASKTMAQLFPGFSAAKLDAMKELVPDILKDVAVYNEVFKAALAATLPATIEALKALAAVPSQLPDWKSKVKNHPGDPPPNTLEYVMVVRNRAASDSVYFYNTVHNLLATDLPEGCQAAAMPGLVKAEARFIFKSVQSYAAVVKVKVADDEYGYESLTSATSAGRCFGRCNDIVRLTIRVETIEEVLIVLQCLHRSALIFILRQKNRLDPDKDMSMIGGYRDYQLVVAFKRDAASVQAHGGPALMVAEIQINLAGSIDVKEGVSAAGGGGGHLKFKKARGFNGYSPETVSYDGAPSMELAEKIQGGMLLSVKLGSEADEAIAAAMGKALASSTCRVQSFDFGGNSKLVSGFDGCASLVTLNLRECMDLTTLPDSFGKCANLESLNVSFCSNLTTLPDSLGECANLQSLDLPYCNNLAELPDSLGKCANLKSLNLGDCSNLTTLPDGLGECANLKSMNLSGCDKLTMLPEGMSKLVNLQTLNLSGCAKLAEPLPNLSPLLPALKVKTDDSTSDAAKAWAKRAKAWAKRGMIFMEDGPRIMETGALYLLLN